MEDDEILGSQDLSAQIDQKGRNRFSNRTDPGALHPLPTEDANESL